MKKLLLPAPMSILIVLCLVFVDFGMRGYAGNGHGHAPKGLAVGQNSTGDIELSAVPSAAVFMDVPTKRLTIYNNSKTDTIYPVLAGYVGEFDLWLQAQFGISPADAHTRAFCNFFPDPTKNTLCNAADPNRGKSALFRAYINFENGIAPQESVSVDIPFYTQLKETTDDNLGKISAQFIDWWNASRVFLYNGNTAKTGAYYYNVDEDGNIVSPPPVVTPVSGAAVPHCAADNEYNCETSIPLVRYVGVYPTGSIPFQLGEYTLAAAEGPPPGGLLMPGSPFTIDIGKTNFNVSAVDGIYLPVAMAAMLKDDPVDDDQQYLGTTEEYSAFRHRLETFSDDGKRWPFYWPSYFAPSAPTTALPMPPTGFAPYVLPSIPSGYVLIAESYTGNLTPSPPVISSNTMNGDGLDPMLGKDGKELVQLWHTCTSSLDNDSDTCQQIRIVRDFFLDAYDDCGFSGDPKETDMLKQVYGWAQWPGCSLALANVMGYNTAINTYCELQYNYLFATPNSGNDDTFNAYNELVHKELRSNAYGFSIDDKAAFKSVPSTHMGTSPGLIITIGGSKGLPDPNNQVPLPDKQNFAKYCH